MTMMRRYVIIEETHLYENETEKLLHEKMMEREGLLKKLVAISSLKTMD